MNKEEVAQTKPYYQKTVRATEQRNFSLAFTTYHISDVLIN